MGPVSRRAALGRLGGLGAGALGSAMGCGTGEDEPLRVPLGELPLGGRLELDLSGTPVELRRTEAGVEARSLLCPHMGCPLRWRETEGDYLCPCHEGRFAADGSVLEGPATQPLRAVPARVEAGEIIVG